MENKSLLQKIYAGTLVVFGALAAFFYLLFSKEKTKNIAASNTLDIKAAEQKASQVAQEKHDEVKKDGSIAVANDIANMLDK